MVLTRRQTMTTQTDIAKIIDEKFEIFKSSILEELKKSILDQLQNDISVIIDEEKKRFEECIAGKMRELPDTELVTSVEAIKVHVRQLQDDNRKLNALNNTLRLDIDDIEQYGRRPNLRLYGVPPEKNETSKMVEAKVKDVLGDLAANSPEIGVLTFDRAHRVGKPKEDSRGIKQQAIIVRFQTFRDRTLVYRARKSIKERRQIGISLDLTKRRLDLLNSAREMTKDVPGIEFVYADVNCNLRVFTENGKHLMFNSVLSLQNTLSNI